MDGFKQEFKAFVCEGDTITCTVDGFDCTATLYRDDSSMARPDKRQDGFWPSLDPKAAGYIGPKSKRTLAREMAKAKAIMQAWENDEWHYYGVAVTVAKNDIPLTGQYDHACWGIEGNYPGGDNSYFRVVANEDLPAALEAARNAVASLCTEVA